MRLIFLCLWLLCSSVFANSYLGAELPEEGARFPIASITKLATALVASTQDLSEGVEITKDDFDIIKGTSSKLLPGVVVSKHKLLELALIGSDNRAASALARTYPGGKVKFVEEMNLLAKRLGANAVFTDPAGLAPTNEASLRAVAILGRALAASPELAELTVKPRANVGRAIWNSTNMFVRTNTLEMLVQKTGFTKEAGSCLFMLLRDGRFLVILGSKNRYAEAKRLLVSHVTKR